MKTQGISGGQQAHFLQEVGNEGWVVLTDPGNLRMVKKFVAGLVKRMVALLLPVPLSDEEAVVQFPHLAAAISLWRAYATVIGYNGPVVWLILAGFTLKAHAPKTGHCRDNLDYLQNWSLRNDEPTTHSIVFWVPRLAEGSMGKSDSEMEALRGDVRQGCNLPSNHCDRFGSIALLFALILRHFKLTGERVPLEFLYAASDTFRGVGGRLVAGLFHGDHGLHCGPWDGEARGFVGFFLLGVEELGV